MYLCMGMVYVLLLGFSELVLLVSLLFLSVVILSLMHLVLELGLACPFKIYLGTLLAYLDY